MNEQGQIYADFEGDAPIEDIERYERYMITLRKEIAETKAAQLERKLREIEPLAHDIHDYGNDKISYWCNGCDPSNCCGCVYFDSDTQPND